MYYLYSSIISVHSNAVGNGVNESVDYPVAYVLLNGSSTDIGLKLAKVVESVMGIAQSGRNATRQGTNGECYGVLRGANAVGNTGYYSGAFIPYQHKSNKMAFQ